MIQQTKIVLAINITIVSYFCPPTASFVWIISHMLSFEIHSSKNFHCFNISIVSILNNSINFSLYFRA